MSEPDIVGLVGVTAYLAADALLRFEKLTVYDPLYLALNAMGSTLIIVSLFYSFNLPSLITQLLWLCLTIVGLSVPAKLATPLDRRVRGTSLSMAGEPRGCLFVLNQRF